MNLRQINAILIVVGVVLVVGAILIDPLRGYDVYLAPVQIVAVIVGIVIGLVGVFLSVTQRTTPPLSR